jgi:hypothetical protein
MALDFVSQIATDYLMGLGKTVGLYKDCVNQPDKVSAEVSCCFVILIGYTYLTSSFDRASSNMC